VVSHRNKIWWSVSIAAAFIAVFGLIWLVFLRSGAELPDLEPTGQKVIRMTYTLSNSTAENIEAFRFSAFAPVNIPGYQTLEFLETTSDYAVSGEPHISNIDMRIKGLAPYASRVITMTLGVGVYDGPKYERINPSDYLGAETYIEVDEPDIKRLSNRIVEGTTNFPKSAFEWVQANIADAGYIAQNRGARFAIQERLGDCTEFMYAFVALARAQGIPARGVAGFVVNSNAAVLSASDYHNWAEFHDGERWILVDPYRGVFDDQYENYLAFRLIGGTNNYSGSARRFLAVDERVSVRF
jgi:transglutaminase-like putative cysteine protease